MALKKEYITDYGNAVDYWKVVDLSINWLTKIGRITLAGYVSEETRRDNKIALEKKYYNVNPKEFDATFGAAALDNFNPISQSYKYVQNKDEFFKDATNV